MRRSGRYDHVRMRIDLRDDQRRPVGKATVDLAERPTRIVAEPAGSGASRMSVAPSGNGGAPAREVFLHWETAVDDSGQLRRCVACGCTDLFTEKAFPQVTAIIVVLAFTGAIVGAVGWASTPVLYGMLIILILDVAILVLSRRRLVCYRCRSAFRDLPIARYHRSWDRAVADRHPLPTPAKSPLPASTSPAGAADAAKPSEPDTDEHTINYFASG